MTLTDNILFKKGISLFLIIAILIIDQCLKIYIKTSFSLGEMRSILGVDWANLYFVENKGMAFGLDVIGGTILLCSFRIVAVAFMVYFLYIIIENKLKFGFVICFCLVLAGAAGNIFDNVLYGAIFSESTPWSIASFVPLNEGYSTFFTGRVVDMFYFPIIKTTFPSFVPFYGGEPFVFFSPIFNFADSAITCGAISILLFYRKELQKSFLLFNSPSDNKESED